MVDRPNARSSHSSPVIRGGGVAIIVTVFGLMEYSVDGAGLIIIRISMALILLLAAISFADDLRSVGARIRFGCHSFSTIVILCLLGVPRLPWDEPLATMLSVGAYILGFFWIVGYTNAFNFMDGINGIASIQAGITGVGGAILGVAAGLSPQHPAVVISFAVGGAAIGFLPHNFPRARMFMGDVGSAPLGFLLAIVTWWMACSAGWWLLIPLGALHANFVLDTGITLIRRVVRGERWHEAHREHFYQRLVRTGWSHTCVTMIEAVLQLAVLCVLITFLGNSVIAQICASLVVGFVWITFFWIAEKRFLLWERSATSSV